MIAAHRASYAVAFTRASKKADFLPSERLRHRDARVLFKGGRLRAAFGAARRRPDRCRIHDQELKTEPLPCLVNSAGSSTYPTRKSVRTTRATPAKWKLMLLKFFVNDSAFCFR